MDAFILYKDLAFLFYLYRIQDFTGEGIWLQTKESIQWMITA